MVNVAKDFPGPVMNGAAVLRQLEPERRSGMKLAITGVDAGEMREAAEEIGWEFAPIGEAEIVAVYSPWEAPVQIPSLPKAKILCVVVPAGDAIDSTMDKVRSRSFREYISLNDWFSRLTVSFGIPEGLRQAGARFLRKTKVNEVVGSRMCGLTNEAVTVHRFHALGYESVHKASMLDKVNDLIMSFFGIGHLPLFAANFASLAVVLIASGIWATVGMEGLQPVLLWTALVSTILGVILEPWSAKYYFADDAREVVLDEVAGMAITLLFLPVGAGVWGFVLAFCLFRFFDIFKFGVHWIEKTGWRGTVIYDDLIAGLYAGLCLAGIYLLV